MSNPFAHDVTSNAATDFSFSEDQGVPDHHLVSFMQAMDAPTQSLGEEDYRYPGARSGGDDPVTDTSQPDAAQSCSAPQEYRPGYYPRGYAP